MGIATDAHGNWVVGDRYRLWMVCRTAGTYFQRQMTAGKAYIVAGTGDDAPGPDGPATQVALSMVSGIVPDGDGLLLVARSHGLLRRLGPDAAIRTVAGGGLVAVPALGGVLSSFANLDGGLNGIARGANGQILVTNGGHRKVWSLD